jgi:hypothetical protein
MDGNSTRIWRNIARTIPRRMCIMHLPFHQMVKSQRSPESLAYVTSCPLILRIRHQTLIDKASLYQWPESIAIYFPEGICEYCAPSTVADNDIHMLGTSNLWLPPRSPNVQHFVHCTNLLFSRFSSLFHLMTGPGLFASTGQLDLLVTHLF